MGNRQTRGLAGICMGAVATLAGAQAVAPPVRVIAETEAAREGSTNQPAILRSAETVRVIGSAGLGGIETYGIDGRRGSTLETGEVTGLDSRAGVSIGGRARTLVAAVDRRGNSLKLFEARSDGVLEEIGARAVPLGFSVENVCLFRSAVDGETYAIATGDGGEIDQQLLFTTAAGRIDARPSRRISLPSKLTHCVADDRDGSLYVAEQEVGIWRFNADPEANAAPRLVDAPRLGRITEEVGGLALHDGGPGARWLIASDASSGRLFAYDREKDDAFAGAVSLAGIGGEPVKEPGGLAAGSGYLVAADEDAKGGANYKIIPFAALAKTLGVTAGKPQLGEAAAAPFVRVKPRVETPPVASAGDAADDPAIWADPEDPRRSLIVATDKKGGLYLYDMAGKVLQHLEVGKMNNVDLRQGFMLANQPVVVVTATDRTRKAIAIYVLDTKARRLIDVADGVQASGLSDPYGLCMYREKTGRMFVFASDPDGLLRQWELVGTLGGKISLRSAGDVSFSGQTEGCVADDEAGIVYVAEEDVGLWQLPADPLPGRTPVSVQAIADNPKLAADLEGTGLYDLGDGRGYLVVSSQGNNSYAVYRREGDRAYLGSFAVVADGAAGIDGISETDGLDVTSRNLGPGFEAGVMVAQDGRNVLPSERQNYKFVAWSDIAKALKLEVRR